MTDERICCPKCLHQQNGGTECTACGIIFEKYEAILQRQYIAKTSSIAEEHKTPPSHIPVKRILQGLGLVTVTALVTLYFVKPETTATLPTNPQKLATEIHQKTAPAITPQPKVRQNDIQQQNRLVSSGDAIQLARQATVSIETPWGTGSGFFISNNFIVTNRHVVEINQEHLAEFRQKVETSRDLINLERKKIQTWQAQLRQLPKGPTREQLRIIIAEHERELAKVLPQYEGGEQQLKKMLQNQGSDNIMVIMEDGSQHSAYSLQVSNNYDLAILSISVTDHPHLQKAPDNYPLRQGDKVYTIGSPVGLRNTVTAGVFSSYRSQSADGKVFLQTDAPINPGNSGGPLIDEKGYIRGVNTMIILNTEGIGFAIPIEKVFEDFGASLY